MRDGDSATLDELKNILYTTLHYLVLYENFGGDFLGLARRVYNFISIQTTHN